ncbi:MAG: cobalt transporter [Clostridiaceae bacterium]|nr:cobalt transporter [Clostridiaceae bacterium]
MGVFYAVRENGMNKADEATFFKEEEGVCILTMDEWQRDNGWKEKFRIWHRVDTIHYCKMESYRDFLFGTMCVPQKEDVAETAFAMYILKNRVLFLDADGSICEQVKTVSEGVKGKEYSIERFLYDFLQSFLVDDFLYLEHLEAEIAVIEEKVLQGMAEGFSYRMLQIKKAISKFYHYYNQLSQIGEELLENGAGFFGAEELQSFHIYADRVRRLAEETKALREYAMQVQEVYQSEIGIRQNNVMKMLTVVTTIFLPLSLIAAWYGMNFTYMPELGLRYAYPVVIGCSILIVAVSLIIFKKKKYW